MASIKLLPKKEFEITLDDGTLIYGHFGTWAMARYQSKLEYAAKKDIPYSLIDGYLDYLLASVEDYARNEGKSFSYNTHTVSRWVDEIGGPFSEGIKSLLEHAELTAVTGEEKKTEGQ